MDVTRKTCHQSKQVVRQKNILQFTIIKYILFFICDMYKIKCVYTVFKCNYNDNSILKSLNFNYSL